MIKKLLENKSNTKKANIKAQVYSDFIKDKKSKGIKAYTFKDVKNRVFYIETAEKGILKNGKIEKRTDGGSEPIWFRVSVNGKYLNGDGWYGFVNPPLNVPDGTTRTIKDSRNNDIELKNYKEDIEEALLQMLLSAVK